MTRAQYAGWLNWNQLAPTATSPHYLHAAGAPPRAVRSPRLDFHEPKLDGIRALAYIENGIARLVSRNGNISFPDLTAAIGPALPLCNAILDGEIVYLSPDGTPQFYELMRRRKPQHLYAFDTYMRSICCGVRFIATSQGIDTDQANPTAKLILWILAAVAAFERDMTRERVGAGVKNYREAYRQGRIGKDRSSKSGQNLPVGGQGRIFDRVAAIEMAKTGKSYRAIAAAFGVGVGTIHRLVAASKNGQK